MRDLARRPSEVIEVRADDSDERDLLKGLSGATHISHFSEHPPFPTRLMHTDPYTASLDVADDRKRDSERTTIVANDGGRRGNAGIILLVALVVIVLAVLFFAGVFDRGDERELNVEVNTPDVNVIVPETQPPVVTVPEVQVPPDVNVNVTTPPLEPPEENLSNTESDLNNIG